jgi:hypothetical protein
MLEPPRTHIQIWHPIDGKWVDISQVYHEHEVKYYTDGKLVLTLTKNQMKWGE